MQSQPILASSHAASRRTPATNLAQQRALSVVTIDVTVPGTSSASGRSALQKALGEGARLFVIEFDKRNACITFRIDVMAHSIGDVVGALAGALRRATIGRVHAVCVAHPIARRH
jgi:DNA-binding NarL/FixJ family response regulator